MRAGYRFVAMGALVAVAACEVPDPKEDTGGLGGGESGAGECDRGISVISTEYQSTSVAFVGWDGTVLSPRVITSGSADVGLSAPLSGDVVAPTVATSLSETVLIDRYPASVLTWLDLATGRPRAQLPVGTGFAANPQDYLQVAGDLGFVARYEANPQPGREPFDGGSDLLAIDPRGPELVGRVGLEGALDGDDGGLVATPSRMLLAQGKVVVLLGVLSSDFQSAGDARLAVIDPKTRAIVETIRIDGLQNCQAMALSPAGDRIAIGCTGLIGDDFEADIDHAGVALVTVGTGGAPSVVSARFAATALGRSPQFTIAFASEDTVLFPTFGTDPAEGGDAHGDDLVELRVSDGSSRVLLTTKEAFKLGDVRCASSCGTCFVADAEAVALRRFTVDGAGALTAAADVQIDDGIGLLPRYLGAL